MDRRPNMSRIRSTNTSPEMLIRKVLRSAGFGYRLHDITLPGKPDIVFPGRRKVIFVHGCFWHHHAGCRRATMPSSNQAYWTAKLSRNKARDVANVIALHEAGWKVKVFWECEIRNLPLVTTELTRFLIDEGEPTRSPIHAKSEGRNAH